MSHPAHHPRPRSRRPSRIQQTLFATGKVGQAPSFDEVGRLLTVGWIRLIAAVLGVAALVLWPTDWLLFDGGSPAQRAFFWMRVGFVASTGGAWLALRAAPVRRVADWVLVAMCWGCVLSAGLALWAVPGSGMEWPWLYSGYLLRLASLGAVVPLRRRALIVVAITAGPAPVYLGLNPQYFTEQLLFVPFTVMVVAGFVAVATGHVLYRLLEQNYFQSLELARKRDSLREVNDRLSGELELKAADLGRLLDDLDRSVEAERTHLSRELHDELGQVLSGLRIEVALARAQVDEPELTREALGKLDRLLQVALDTVSGIVRGLRPRAVDELGLAEAARQLVVAFAQRAGLPCDARIDLAGVTVASEPANHVYRILQEALTNVGRHAQATSVAVRIEASAEGLSLLVSDNGRGFDASEAHQTGRHGVIGMRERAHALGAELRIDSALGRGAHIYLEVPVSRLV